MKWINWFNLPILYWPIPIVLHNLTGSNLTGGFSPFSLELESQHFFSLMRYHLYLNTRNYVMYNYLSLWLRRLSPTFPKDFRFAIVARPGRKPLWESRKWRCLRLKPIGILQLQDMACLDPLRKGMTILTEPFGAIIILFFNCGLGFWLEKPTGSVLVWVSYDNHDRTAR